MVVASKDEWKKLNKRQQAYMQALYDTDQEQEAEEKLYAARTQRSRPADEWRWMKYADTLMGYTPLKKRLITAKVVDAGTGSTFEALKERGYVLIRHELTMVGNTIPFLRLTTKGRKLVRSALQIQPSQNKWPTGQLREWHWKALCAAWKAGDDGLKSESGYYARIGWNTWLRLRDYKVKGEERPLADEERVSVNWTSHAGGFMTYNQEIRMKITDFGKHYYRENWQRYRELYPDVEAPEPQEEGKA